MQKNPDQIIIKKRRNAQQLSVVVFITFKTNAVNTDSAVFGISVDAFHTIVADYTSPSKGWSSLDQIELRTFTEKEYHAFFRRYQPDPMMDPSPFRYNQEQISRSYAYNHGGFRENYEHLGIFLNHEPVGSFQLKRIDRQKKQCEFGIILRDDSVKNKGIGTEAIRQGMKIAKDRYGIQTFIGDTMGRNKRMMRVFEKLGFFLSEKVTDAFDMPDGTKEDRYVYIKQLTEEEG